MEWKDNGIIIGRKMFGESHVILELLTENQGKRKGLVHGAKSKQRQHVLELGNTLSVTWKGRTQEQLGYFSPVESVSERANRILESPTALSAIQSVTALLRTSLNEGDGNESNIFEVTQILLNSLEDFDIWPALYVKWEIFLLSSLGFGLDLTHCALSGATEGLTHVSPRTGKAVRHLEAQRYVDKLLRIPEFLLRSDAEVENKDLKNGLKLTGYFIKNRMYAAIHKAPPAARDILVHKLID